MRVMSHYCRVEHIITNKQQLTNGEIEVWSSVHFDSVSVKLGVEAHAQPLLPLTTDGVLACPHREARLEKLSAARASREEVRVEHVLIVLKRVSI